MTRRPASRRCRRSAVPVTSHAGAYPITAAEAVDADYAISYVSGTLTIGQAALTITADDQGMTYGGTLPALTATYTGLVNGDTPASLTTLPTLSTVSATSHTGTYPITATGAVDADYAISYVSGTLTIGQAALTITADDQGMTYGGTLPTLTATYTGLVNGDTPASLTTLPTLSTVSATSHAGTYPITATGRSMRTTPSATAPHAHHRPGRLDDCHRQPAHDLRRHAARLDRHLHGFGERRHAGQSYDAAHTRHRPRHEPRRGLSHHRRRGGRCGLRHQLRLRHAHHRPGGLDDQRRRPA